MTEATGTMNTTAAVNIGNYKGVMLCNRPFNGVSSSLAKDTRMLSNSSNSSLKSAFLAGIPNEPLGMNVVIHNDSPHAVKRDKKHTALSKHKKWLHDLQKERARLEEALTEDEENIKQRRERFAHREAKFRESVRNNNAVEPEETNIEIAQAPRADKKATMTRPMWSLTKETADEKIEYLEEAEADDLIDFANNLDIDAFMDDVEIKARVAQVEQQMTQLQSLVEQEEADEKRHERELLRSQDDKNNAALNANSLARLDNSLKPGGDGDDDAMSVASTVLSECKSIRSVHSVRSVAALTKRMEAKLLDNESSERISTTPLHPRVITIDEEGGVRMQIKTLPSNLPYIHRNPAI